MGISNTENQVDSAGKGNKKKWHYVAVVIVIVAVLMISVVAYPSLVRPSQKKSDSRSQMNVGPLCSSLPLSSPSPKPMTGPLSRASYDETLTLFLDQNFTTIHYNVTFVIQNDSYGYGPSYLVNGLTLEGYWYQAGVSWNPALNLAGYSSGSYFTYEVWSTNGRSIFPSGGGAGEVKFAGRVSNGDVFLVSLSFAKGDVVMSARDWNTSAEASISYNAYGASQFISGFKGDFANDIITEWNLASPYFCSPDRVVFSNFERPVTSAWMCIEESNNTLGIPIGSINVQEESFVFSGCSSKIYYNANTNSAQSYELGGTIEYSDAYEFVTM